MENTVDDIKKDKLMIATLGSKNRVCLPPNIVNFFNIAKGDTIVIITGVLDNGRKFGYFVPATLDDFRIPTKKIKEIDKSLA